MKIIFTWPSAAVALLLYIFSAPSGMASEYLTQEEKDYLHTKKEIVFVSQTLYPPFEFVDKHGDRTGMMVELARWIATEFGFKAVFTDTSFEEAQRAILSGRADVLTSFFYSEKRDETFDFTKTVFEVPAAIFIPADRPDIRGIEDLHSKVIAIQKGDYALDFLNDQHISFKALETAHFAEATDLTIAGRADAVVGDEQIVLYHLYSNNLTKQIKKVGKPLYTGQNCMAVREGNRILIGILQKGVDTAREKGVLESIERKWLGIPLAPQQSILERYGVIIAALFAALIAIVVLVWIWNLQLRKRVAARTRELSLSEGLLQESEKKYRYVVDNVNVGIVVLQDGRVVFANQGIASLLNISREELFSDPDPFHLIHPEDRQMVRQCHQQRLMGDKNVPENYRFRVVTKKGDTRWTEVTGVRIDWEGQPATLNFFLDVSGQVQAEQAVRESQRRLQEIFNSIRDLVYTQDMEGRFLSLNRALTKLLGYGQEELIGHKAAEFMKPEYQPLFESEYLETIKRSGFASGTTVYKGKDGRDVYLEYQSTLVTPEEGAPYISGVGRDVTERILAQREMKRLEEEMLQAKKMEAIGVLAGGIAHDFNNLLMGIQGTVSLLLLQSNFESRYYEKLKNIEHYVQKGSELTKQLLGFARKGKYEVKPLDINDLVHEGAVMFGRTKKEITIHSEYQENVWTVEADRGQIDQVLLNLYLNASQAMPSGGDIYIGTLNSIVDEDLAKRLGISPGRYVKISVTDTGIGMDEETRKRVFEPFFTTRAMGERGNGLGLASAYGIIKNHGGAIDVISEPGKGATFTIYLPATDRPVEIPTPDKVEIEAGRKETILLVDDEEMILEVGCELLDALGYHVLSARSGVEAVEVYRQNRDGIDLVILDMIMPGMGGGQTFEVLKEIDPDVRVLLSSGYSIDGQAQAIINRGCKGFIQKPYSLEELSKRIRAVIAG